MLQTGTVIDLLFFFSFKKGDITQAGELEQSCNTLNVTRDGTEFGRRQRVSVRGRLCSGVSGIDGGFITGGHASVPAAVALLLLDAGVVPGLVAGITEVGQHVRP